MRLQDANQSARGWDLCVNSYTLPDALRRAACQASFFGDIADVRDPMAALMSKVLNSRCQARKYGTVAEKLLMPTPAHRRRYEHVRAKWRAQTTDHMSKQEGRDVKCVEDVQEMSVRCGQFRRLLLCSLLGNYPHCRTRIRDPAARAALYARLVEHPREQAFFQSLLHGCSKLVVWCVRDFLVHTLRGDIALREQVYDVMHLAHFEELTQQAMSVARAYIEARITRGWTSLYRAVQMPPHTLVCTCGGNKKHACVYADQTWLGDVSRLLRPYHERMLETQYQKPHVDVVAWLVSSDARKAAPPVRRPGAPRLAPIPVLNLLDFLLAADGDGAPCAAASQAAVLKAMAAMASAGKKHAKNAADVMVNALAFVSAEQFAALRSVVAVCADLVEVVRDAFVHLGCAVDARDYALELLEHHRTSSVPKQMRVRLLVHLRARDPYAYNLLQVAAELLKERGPNGSGGRQVGRMCVETHEAQLSAAHRRMLGVRQHLLTCQLAAVKKVSTFPGCRDLDTSDAQAEIQDAMLVVMAAHERAAQGTWLVEKTSAHLHFCHVCGTVYSNVRRAYNPMAPKYYRYGLRNALRHYTGPVDPAESAACRNHVSNHNGACGRLTSVDLFGIRYALGKVVYQLCVGCADIMQAESDVMRTGFACTGLLCSDCTRVQRKAAHDPLDDVVAALVRQCVCCNKLTSTNAQTFLIGHGLVLCRIHAKSRLVDAIAARHTSTQDELRKYVIEMYVAACAWRRARAQPGDMRRLKLSKMRARMRK